MGDLPDNSEVTESSDTKDGNLLSRTSVGALQGRVDCKTSAHHRTSLVRSDVIWDLEDELFVNTAV